MREIRSSRANVRWLAAAAIALIAAACTSSSSPAPSTAPSASGGGGPGASIVAKSNYNITLVTGEQKDSFYVTMAAGAKAEAEKLGVTLNWQAPSAFDPSLQIPVFDSVLASKPQFLIAVPDDATALIVPLKKFGDANIPVITADTDVTDTSVRLGNITSDNELGGTLAAKTLADVLGSSGGKVFLLCVPPGITTGELRKKGFEAEVKNHSALNYVGSDIYNGTDPTDAARVMGATLKRVPDLAGVVACDGPAGLGASTAINEAGQAGKVKLISFDAGPDLVAALKRNVISALLIQQSFGIGATGVDYAVQYLNGGFTIPPDTKLGYILGTPDNIDSPDVQKFLSAP